MLSIPKTLRSHKSLPQSLRNNHQLSPNEEDACILAQTIYRFQGEVTSLDNHTWFLTYPQDRSECFVATFAGLTTGDILEVEDVELKSIGKRKFIWKVWGKLGRIIRLERGYLIFKFHPYWVRLDNDEEKITTLKLFTLAVPHYYARLSTINKWIYKYYYPSP